MFIIKLGSIIVIKKVLIWRLLLCDELFQLFVNGEFVSHLFIVLDASGQMKHKL